MKSTETSVTVKYFLFWHVFIWLDIKIYYTGPKTENGLVNFPATAVYGPPPTSHLEYGPPSAYGAPTAPAHFSAPGGPTGYAVSAHKYPSQLDGKHTHTALQPVVGR